MARKIVKISYPKKLESFGEFKDMVIMLLSGVSQDQRDRDYEDLEYHRGSEHSHPRGHSGEHPHTQHFVHDQYAGMRGAQGQIHFGMPDHTHYTPQFSTPQGFYPAGYPYFGSCFGGFAIPSYAFMPFGLVPLFMPHFNP